MSSFLIFCIIITFLYFFFNVGIALAWFTVPESNAPNKYVPKTRISVIIAVRNEAENIQKCVESIIAQNYDRRLFEIIVVDDFSTDNTLAIIQKIHTENIKILSLGNYYNADIIAHKKKCIDLGIKNASGSLIVTTDGDCFVGKNWLRTIAYAYETTQAKILAAPVKILHQRSILEKFQSLDYTGMMALTAVGVYYKFLSLCNGANMAYEKQAFLSVNGFEDIDQKASGDDVLLMEKINKQFPNSLFFIKSKSAIVETFAAKGLLTFIQQRIRWTSKSKLYSEISIKLIAVMVLLCALAIIILFGISLMNSKILAFAIVLLMLKSLADFILLATSSAFFSNSYLLIYFPVLEILHLLYIAFIGVLGNIFKANWKGRKV